MTANSPCPQAAELQAFAQGSAAPNTVQAVALHLAQCDKCLAYLRRLTAPTPATVAHGPTGNGSKPVAPDNHPAPAYPFLRAPMAADEIGRLGNYRILRLLGRGGMALVFHAEDITLRRKVALKVMKPELGDDLDPWQRFVREARVMANIKHEHLVTVYQASQEGDVVYLAMEMLEGMSLEERIYHSDPPDPALIVRLGREIASGLAVIHQHGLIHRDLKPGNIWLEAPDQHVKILDFGLARAVNDDSNLTQAGMIVGTPAYMSPEQGRCEPLDGRSDLFSLGTVLYCLCTRQRPFRGGSALAELTSLAVDQPRPVHEINPAIPRPLSDLVMQLLAKDRTQRPTSAEEVVERLRQMSSQTSSPAERSRESAAAREQPALPRSDSTPVELATAARKPDSEERPTEPILSRRRLAMPVALVAGAAMAIGLLGMWIGSAAGPRSSAPAPQVGASGGNTIDEVRVYLDQLKQVRSLHFPFEPPRKGPPDKEPPDKEPFDKGPPGKEPFDKGPPHSPYERGIRVNGELFRHGIGMHPHPDGCSVTYELGGQYAVLHARVSLNDSVPRSPVGMVFSVWNGEHQLFASRPVYGREDTQEVRVAVTGVKELTLKVDTVGREEPRGAHGVWLDPYVTKER